MAGMDQDVQQRVLKVIREILDCTPEEIKLDVSFRENLKLDSLKQMTLFIALEDEFQRTIPPEEVTGLETIQDIIDFIHKKLAETSEA